MREIKFRAWDKNKGIFYPDSLMFDGYNKITHLFQHYNLPEDEKSVSSIYNDAVLMQYTGLKDKNGKEIYEGDLLQLDNSVVTCIWNEDEGSWEFKFVKAYDQKAIIGKFEIIGNIYENPELAENK